MNCQNYGDQRSDPLDLSTAPSSSSNYFITQQHSSGHNPNTNNASNNYSNQFWRKPNTANTTTTSSNIPTFTPITTAASSSAIPTYNNNYNFNNGDPQTLVHRPQYDTRHLSNYNSIASSSGTIAPLATDQYDYSSEREERLKIDLKIKESQIDTLENEIQRLSESMNMVESKNGNNSLLSQDVKVPKNINEIFNKLANTYSNLEKELQDTKTRLESLVTAITLNPSNTVTNNGRYDELEISHKIILKLDLLKKENEELLKQMSFGKSKQVDIELNLVKLENAKLKEKLKNYEEKL